MIDGALMVMVIGAVVLALIIDVAVLVGAAGALTRRK
jgi:hypothetical protein